MAIKVGIPRALFFYYYYPQWKRFLENLGAEVVLSPPTNKRILDDGIRSSVDEACLPVKVFFGHALALKGKAEFLFTPRLVSLEKKAYICPKFMGLPDMLRWSVSGLPELIDTTFDLSRNEGTVVASARKVGRYFSESEKKIDAAWKDACEYQERYVELLMAGNLPLDALKYVETGKKLPPLPQVPRMRIAVVGHGYNIYDEYVSMNLIRNLQAMGVHVVTPDILPSGISEAYAATLPKKMFWAMGKKILGSVLHYIDEGKLDGILYTEAFGCGPDSMIEDLSARFVRRNKKIPFQVLTLDEHSGEAGVLTRLEAFVDMIAWRGVS